MEPEMRVGSDLSVALLRWPRDAEQREACARAGRARLLLVDAGVTPPVVRDDEEDWIRVPADERDLYLRIKHLEGRSASARGSLTLELGMLTDGRRRVVLSAVEERLVGRLLQPAGSTVSRAELARVAWGDEARAPRSLDAAIARARASLATIGHTIVAVRGRGYLLAELDIDG